MMSRKGIALDQDLQSSGGDERIPSTDKLAASCLTDDRFDSCLYLKNPVAQEQQSVSDLRSAQKFGVKIRGLGESGALENSYVQVATTKSPRVSAFQRNQLKAEFDPNTTFLQQIQAYYWANRLTEYLRSRVGSQNLPATRIRIYIDDAFTGVVAKTHSVHLQNEEALSGDVVVQLYAQAWLSQLTSNRIFQNDTVHHSGCKNQARGCCKSDMGCAQALANAFGDYFAAVMFEDKPILGESLSDSPQGQSLCSRRRDLRELNKSSRGQMYNSCATTNGHAVLLGSWYASLWWKIRTQAQSPKEIDRTFVEHAKTWTSVTTFEQAKQSAESLGGANQELIKQILNDYL